MKLTFKRDWYTGDWQASLDHYFHSLGPTKDAAAKHLWLYMKEAHPREFAEADRAISGFLHSKKNAPAVSDEGQ